MSTQKTIHVPVRAVLVGLMLAACGGVAETGGASAEEPQGTTGSALCSDLSIDLSGISTYQGVMAGMGNWAVSTPANAVRLEYSVDGIPRISEDRCNASGGTTSCTGSGSWYFSVSGISCGPHTFQVKASPMVIDSAGNRSVCLDSPVLLSQTVTESCPMSWHNCTRKTATTVECNGVALGGTPPYTAYWKVDESGSWLQGSMTQSFTSPLFNVFYFKVKDAAGLWSSPAPRVCTQNGCF